MSELSFDNSRTLLAGMDRLSVDKTCVFTALAMLNGVVCEQIQRYPDRLNGFCDFVSTACAEWSGEAEFSPHKVGEEVDFWVPTTPLGSASSSARCR